MVYDDDSVRERIAAMRLIEASSAYQCRDYLDGEYLSSLAACSTSDDGRPVDTTCRTRMIEWMYSIVEFGGFDRDTVSVAASIADRFLSQNSEGARLALRDRRRFQLVFMTALHVAVKIREQSYMDGPLLEALSRGRCAAQEFIDCERQLLESIGWRVNCPTAMEFVYEFLSLLPANGVRSSFAEDALVERCRRLSELAALDSKFMTTRPSTLALTAIALSVEDMSSTDFPFEHRSQFFSALEDV
eukprot:CAMPEP_0197445088 /NCGR_PEP_ID=MMETSP1175-20131217/10393_1 /TAXON_ID=1003142 /ORGANISM="Triceratium dubium, Strain CCMP147" /LENGTH=244 /DNA_ID=CAMNT_0042975991 /DNA_START=100 /DNA_END=830 /DNA_ORIENTATION=+